MHNGLNFPRKALFGIILLIAASSTLNAQYFGRNKVQWERFDFQVIQTEHFDIHYYGDDRTAVEDAARMAERWYERLSGVFNHQFTRKPIVFYSNHADFQQTTIIPSIIGEGTGGFTDALKNRIVMPLTGSYADTDHVLGHEMVHVFQYDIAQIRGPQGQRRFQLEQLPLWMIEGLAEYLSIGRVDAQSAMWLRDAVMREHLPTVRDFGRNPNFSPYRTGHAFWSYIAGRYGDEAVIQLFLGSGVYGIEQAFRRVLQAPASEVFADWHASARSLYEPVIAQRLVPEALGEPFLGTVAPPGARATRGDLYISPAVSPDGRYVAFISTRDLFSIDLFLIDTQTGEINRLIRSERDEHYDALRFIDSAGSWSPDGSKFAFVVFERGANRIAILDVATRRIEQRIEVPGVGAVSNPVWSPDGTRLAFSGATVGISNLYTLTIGTLEVQQLTSDRHAVIHPAWSPDGGTITFATDRGPETNFQQLTYSPMTLASLDLTTRQLTVHSLFPGAKHINPQYSPDGRSLYFIANPEGVADIFRYSLDDQTIYRVTQVATGVAGITEHAPAMSVAARTGQIYYSIFSAANWTIHALPAAQLAGTPVPAAAQPEITRGALLPPATQPTGRVASYLERPVTGLPPPGTEYPESPYRPRLTLDFVGPAIGVGFDRQGLGVGGTATLLFGDVLNRHQVGVTLQGGGTTDGGSLANQLGGQVFYLNQERRIHWGAVGSHIPYVNAITRQGRQVVEIDGQPVLADVIQQRRDTVLLNEFSAISRYPLTISRRFEANLGYTRLGYDSEVEQIIIVGNRIIDRSIIDLPAPPSFDYYRGAVAYVGDTSFFGIASPIRGARHRFEVETIGGDVNFQTALADWRRYFFRNPLTFAVRGMHYGRYGSGAEDPRVTPLNIGRPTLVRGYEGGSFDIAECTPVPGISECPEFERLLGSRIGVVNLELRAPLFGTGDYGIFNVPSFPLEIAAFLDGGVAWRAGDSPNFTFDRDTLERVPVFSAGVTLRTILLGYLPLQFYWATPLQRPQEDVVFGFLLAPGW
jgi:hypothetical protein